MATLAIGVTLALIAPLGVQAQTKAAGHQEEASSSLQKSAEAGNPTAQCELGVRCEHPPLHQPRRLAEAVRWYRAAADQGHAGGQVHLALCYLEGAGVEADEERALDLMRRAADQDYHEAIMQLVELYARGVGEPRGERDKPIALLQHLVKEGHGSAYEQLIFRYQFGLGTERDLVAAAHWYCRSWLAGDQPRRLRERLSVDPQPPDAGATYTAAPGRSKISIRSPATSTVTAQLLQVIALYLKASLPNHPQALVEVGQLYLDGRLAPRSPAKAWVWMTLARERGASAAPGKLAELEATMSEAERTQARAALGELKDELGKIASVLN